ncbi:tRNA methyltransferase 1 isoform X2 [Oratosquilla oratoria]|uniref:tRNA methyltransferase 1 isoform X2 n=1 Tax=Oratosquilla oratoria TaxID=337810 RepID=UPI003F76D842
MPRLIEENGVKVDTQGCVSTPKKNEIMYNPDMVTNRSIIICALAAYKEMGWCINPDLRCLDALGATGIAGLAWARMFPKAQVTVNDPYTAASERIRENTSLNNLEAEVCNMDVSVLLHQRPFDFVFLDCYGSSVQYLDAVFRNVPKNGVVAITSTDDAALYGKASDVTLRNYGGHIIKTFFAKELAARLILASVVRSAAKCNKGIEVLCCVALKSFITVIIRVIRGPSAANECVRKIRQLLHCCMCEDRVFYPLSAYPIENPYSLLSCDCRRQSSGKLAVILGPVWCDEIFHPAFCEAMVRIAHTLHLPPRVTSLLQMIVSESRCEGLRGEDLHLKDKENKLSGDEELEGERDKEDDYTSGGEGGGGRGGTAAIPSSEDMFDMPLPKKMKVEPQMRTPSFYFNLHRHSPKGHDLGKMSKIVEHVQRAGFKASRTHFDSEAIRTNATLAQFNQLLLEFNRVT